MGASKSDPRRRRMLGVVHMAIKQLAMADDDYRAILWTKTGRKSSADCTIAELQRMIAEFERLGYRAPKGRSPNPASHPVARKARALWIGLHALGAVRDPSERALERFAKRQLGVDRLHWADQSRAFPLIEALKTWAEKEGWSQKVPVRASSAEAGRMLTERLYHRLVALLGECGSSRAFIDPANLDDWALYRANDELAFALREARAARQ